MNATVDGADPRPLAICLMGPTASGKTALALALADHLRCELISVDSAQVYRGMDIGTAKPEPAVLARHPHRLIDIRDPSEPYSAAGFRRDALAAIAQILAAGRTPLLVGGTMLYFRTLIHGLAPMPGADPAIRAGIAELAAREGWAAVHRRLAEVDPGSAARIDPANRQRVQRALEVFLASGRPMSSLHAAQSRATDLPCRLLQLALVPADRAALHRRIAERFHAMLAAGFLDEVRALKARGDLHPDLPAIRSVGYRQAWDYLEGLVSREAMIERAIAATRQLAKRQLTWLRSWPDLETLPAGHPEPDKLLKAALKLVEAAAI
ncbi:MAG: tRNA (adenosine(37)-N6)-dimethylallyltransferase MiaA [Pseudomonadales bacterium]|jgi:tRNA dimethylallyltransferase|nr:tRNA (adenosine(37)-N6)-dimethylallyltransferase MiaA [Pseudomonadales bacterium]MBP9033548.1 tRNA (adenosine(37)-N6)-dimethylallyltransferase MiaA [Pseudomonadales bacterium]